MLLDMDFERLHEDAGKYKLGNWMAWRVEMRDRATLLPLKEGSARTLFEAGGATLDSRAGWPKVRDR